MKTTRWILGILVLGLTVGNVLLSTTGARRAEETGAAAAVTPSPSPPVQRKWKLRDLVVNTLTDKDTGHSYLPVYQELFGSKYVKRILEIGIDQGGSLKLWRDYFPEATVYGIDIVDHVHREAGLRGDPRVVLLFHDAYDAKFVRKTFQGIKLDVAIDDGPHGLDSMKAMILLYLPLLADDGILVIEDVQRPEWFEELERTVPLEERQHIRRIDLRSKKGRYDDMLFVVDRGS